MWLAGVGDGTPGGSGGKWTVRGDLEVYIKRGDSGWLLIAIDKERRRC